MVHKPLAPLYGSIPQPSIDMICQNSAGLFAVVAIGKVTGDYEYKKEYEDDGRHTRSVEWLKNISRSEFDSNSITAFNLPPTVYKIERADDNIKTILRKYGIELE